MSDNETMPPTQSESGIPTNIIQCTDPKEMALKLFNLPGWPKRSRTLKSLKQMRLAELQSLCLTWTKGGEEAAPKHLENDSQVRTVPETQEDAEAGSAQDDDADLESLLQESELSSKHDESQDLFGVEEKQDSSVVETEAPRPSVPVVRLNLAEDEDHEGEENPLDFSGIIEASEGTMETSFDDTRTDNSLLVDVNEFDPSSAPIKELTHKQILPYLLGKWVTHNSAIINLKRMTKAGSYRQVTARGKQLMEKSMRERGILPMEKLLIQQLPEDECVLKDGKPEYRIVDGNHRVTTAREVFGKDDIDWVCDVVKPNCPPDDLMRLACFRNDMHDEAAVHRDEWETFFHVRHYLMQRRFWSTLSNGAHQINWTLFLNFMPETAKLDAVERGKAHNSIRNISGIMRKLSTRGPEGWSKTAAVIEGLYRELREPLQITPLFLRAISIDTPDSVLASTIKLIHEDKGPRFMRKGESGKPKITKAAFRALVEARTRRANFLTKLAFVAQQNKEDWKFIGELIETGKYDAVLVAEEKAIIDALKEPAFNVKRDFKTLLNTTALSTVQRKRREEAAAIKKKLEEDKQLEKRERSKTKKKTDSADREDVQPAQTISEAMTIMPTLCNLINRSVCKHESSGKFSIALADLSSSVPANRKWSPKRINTFMGYLDPNSADAHGIIITSSADELATIMASIRPAVPTSAYVLIRLVSCLIPNVRTKGNIQHNGIFIVYLGFDNTVYTFNENSQLTHDVVKAPKLTSHEKAPNIKKWFKEYTPPTITPAPQIAALFYERILSAYMPENEPASLLDYTPLRATPLNACIQLKWSYHMHIVSSSPSENETKLINSAVLTVLFSTDKDEVLKWISKCKATSDIGGSSSRASSSSSSSTKKSPRRKMASRKSDPGKHHKSDTISQEIEMEEQPKSKGKEKPTTHRRNKSIDSAGRIASSETTASSSSGSSKRKRDSPTPSSPSKIAKTKKTKESKKTSASDRNYSAEEQEEEPQSSSSSGSSSSDDSNSSSSDDSDY